MLPPHQDLVSAFSAFTQTSDQLAATYRVLQGTVTQLTAELALANSALKEQLAEKEALSSYLEALLEAIPAAVFVVQDGYIASSNLTARQWFGKKTAGVAWCVFREQLVPTHVSSELTYAHDYCVRLLSMQETVLSHDTHRLIILHDVTELSEKRESLARCERLTTVGEMAASLAHQLRTPLSSITLYAHHLHNHALSQAKKDVFYQHVQDGLAQLEMLIRDMLFFVKGNSHQFEKTTLDHLLDLVMLAVSGRAETHGMTVQIACPPLYPILLFCHISSLVSALVTLVDNALDASQAGQCVELSCPVTANHIHLCVQDHGSGIPPILLERIFQPFFSFQKRGTGLGLAIVKMVAQAHGGSVTVRSQQDEGSCFTMILPHVVHEGTPA